MNYLYLIGNGFDKAHGLPTSYNEFIFDFYKKAISNTLRSRSYDAGPIKITNLYNECLPPEFSTVSQILAHCKFNNIEIEYNNDFFEIISQNYGRGAWVDIEYAFYTIILDIARLKRLKDYYPDDIIKLNSELEEIKKILIKYLLSIKSDSITLNDSINSHIKNFGREGIGQNLFLNFNYTNVIEKYINDYRGDRVINIHGSLNDNLDDIIFGYGDEMDSMYPEIEKLNNNSFLNNFKSFGYLKKSHYQEVQLFLSSDFEVIIMGHSCGISDRVLLNAIFTNDNCKKIHICYHEKSKTDNDFFEKTQEISRHFGKANKEEMRIKIVPFDQSKPLIPFSEN